MFADETLTNEVKQRYPKLNKVLDAYYEKEDSSTFNFYLKIKIRELETKRRSEPNGDEEWI